MSEIDKETKQSIGAAIVAASEKDYVAFKGAVGKEIEDRLRSAINDAAKEKREKMFSKIAVSDSDDDLDND